MARSTSASLAAFLREVPLFVGLEDRSINRIVEMLAEEKFAQGSTICTEGELGRAMYILRDGEVEVLRTSSGGKMHPIVRLGSGECFGEMTLVELQPRSATIKAKKQVTAYSLTNLDLYNLYRDDNYAYVIVLQNICRMLSRRLRKADGRICEFLAAQVAARKHVAAKKTKTPTRARKR